MPVKNSSITTRFPASPNLLLCNINSNSDNASMVLVQITTPFPAANPSALSTMGNE